MRGVTRIYCDVPVDFINGTSGKLSALIVMPSPDKISPRPGVLFCAPGGATSKAYFDLDAEGDRRFSFAQAMVEQGWITIAVDLPGIGGSTPIEDGYAVDPPLVGAAFATAVAALQAKLTSGLEGYPRLAPFFSVGVGASMGGMIIGWAQAHFRSFDAVVLLGSSPFGLISHLPEPFRDLVDDPMRSRAEIVGRLRAMGLPGYMPMESPDGRPSSIFPGGDPHGLAALRAAAVPLLSALGFFVLIPGSWAPEAAVIEVPLLLIFGDGDLLSNPHSAPAWFKSSTDITVITLKDTGHIHFVFQSMPDLSRRAAAWIQSQINQ